MSTPQLKYPHVRVQLAGLDPSPLAILSRVIAAMHKAEIDEAEIAAFKREALSGNHHHLLASCLHWFDCR
jgi:hypothetical protein